MAACIVLYVCGRFHTTYPFDVFSNANCPRPNLRRLSMLVVNDHSMSILVALCLFLLYFSQHFSSSYSFPFFLFFDVVGVLLVGVLSNSVQKRDCDSPPTIQTTVNSLPQFTHSFNHTFGYFTSLWITSWRQQGQIYLLVWMEVVPR